MFASACVESVKLRGNSTGHASRCRLRPCRIRQAKGELHRARVQVVRACVQVSPPARVEASAKRSRVFARVCRAVKLQGTRPGVASARVESVKLRGTPQGTRPVASARVESVKLRGNSTGHVSRRQAKGELHRARVQVSGHAFRCRLPPVSKRPQSVRVCRTGVSRRQATGHASRCRLRPCRIRQAKFKGELHRAHVQVSPPRVESVKLRGNSTGHAGVSRRQAKGELHRARAQGVAFAAF